MMKYFFSKPKLKKIESSPFKDVIQHFFLKEYQQINIARLQHLESLGLNISEKRVLELGAGVGDHTLFYLYKKCDVLPIDGRTELVEFIKQRLGIQAIKIDFDTELQKLNQFKDFDIIHCYGLLYHLRTPQEFIQTISKLSNTLFLETIVADDNSVDGINIIKEDKSNPTQAVSGYGCRPNRKWLFGFLKQYYNFVYLPKTQPIHIQFPINWNMSISTVLKRAVFIVSHSPINSVFLTADYILNHEKW